MSSYSEQFLKQNPLAVLGVLRDLKKGEVPLRINWSTSQFISKILDVTADAGGESRVCPASPDHDRVPGFACVYRSPAR